MFASIRKRLTVTNVVLTLALVFAMTGGAYAAKKYVITSTKQISPVVLKALQGKAGPAGSQGPAGTAGAAGTAGSAGSKGENGAEGKAGSNGKDGTSVTSKAFTGAAGTCQEGGSEFTAAEAKKTYACNGSPWTAGGTLPSEKSEKGTWGVSGYSAKVGQPELASISFAIPLKKALGASNVIYVKPGEPAPSGCKGTVAEPEAEPGNLCVFSQGGQAVNMASGTIHDTTFAIGASTTGAFVIVSTSAAEEPTVGVGTWAVTAE
jgi:hypothetical protein